jgi:hypothetical protein
MKINVETTVAASLAGLYDARGDQAVERRI